MKKILCLASTVVVMSCAGAQKSQEPAQAAPVAQVQTPTTPAATKVAMQCSSDSSCSSKQLCVDSQCVDITAGLAECKTSRVSFAYDSADITTADRPVIERMSRCLKAVDGMHVTIEGNADERGTEEYNLSLGERRAHAVEKQLDYLGVADTQLKTITYGKDKPLCREHSEDCWAKNRRAAMAPAVAGNN